MAIDASGFLTLGQAHSNTWTTPVSRLPWDLLYEIFAETVASSSLASASSTAIRIAQVCRSWRNVANSMGRLWACHSSENPPQLLRNTLERSAKASLFVEIRTCDVASAPILLRHLSRIEELSITVSGRAFIRAQEDVVRLRKLCLDLNVISVDMDQIEILQDWNMPKLTTLCISHGNLRSVMNLMVCTLTTLSLSFVDCLGASGYHDPITFLNALQNLSSLRHLRLRNSIPPGGIAYDKTIRLPVLCTLHLDDDLVCLDWILQHLDLSSTVLVAVDVVTWIWEEEPARAAVTDTLVNKIYRAMAKTPAVDPVVHFDENDGRLRIAICSCESGLRESCLCRKSA